MCLSLIQDILSDLFADCKRFKTLLWNRAFLFLNKLTFSTESGQDAGTLCFYRNLLNHRGVKGEVKNAYRPYKLLFYTVFVAICQLLLLHNFHLTEADSNILFPEGFQELSKKVKWNGWTWWPVKSYRHGSLKMKKTYVKNWGKC